MVNLPPDQNERRDRDQILSFDELLAVVLALLGVGTILWWSTSRDRDWAGESSSLSNAVPNLMGSDSREGDSAVVDDDSFFSGALALGNRVNADRRDQAPVENPRSGGLPGLVPTQQAEARPAPVDAGIADESESPDDLESANLEPEAVAPEPLTEVPEDTVAPPPLDISDVPEDHWAYPFIKDLYDQGLLPDFPSGQFQPDKELTRAELASLLNEAFVTDPVEREPLAFQDVPSGYWAATAIDQVVERGFMSGYPDNEFGPDQLVPRYQVLVSLASGLNLAPPSDPAQLLQGLGNLEGLPNWAQGQVAATAQQKIVVNYPEPNQLQPTKPATRAEIVAMIHQALASEGRVEPVQSDYIVTPE